MVEFVYIKENKVSVRLGTVLPRVQQEEGVLSIHPLHIAEWVCCFLYRRYIKLFIT